MAVSTGKSPFPSHTYSIAELFAQPRIFEVPPFQRPYSWTVAEAGQLLDDLVAAAGLGRSSDVQPYYFLGAILLLDRGPVALAPKEVHSGLTPPRIWSIIDGQQRLVTVSILIAALRDSAEDDTAGESEKLQGLITHPSGAAPSGRYRLALATRQQEFFERYVLAARACLDMPPDAELLTPAEQAMIQVREHFASELAGVAAADRAKLTTYLLEHCHLVTILSDDLDRAHRMFAVLNDRGKPLRRVDILKSDLGMGLPADEAREIFQRWDAVALALGHDFEDLFGHIRSLHGWQRPDIISAIHGIVAQRGGAKAFITSDVEPLGRAFALIKAPWSDTSPLSQAARRHLVYLNRLNGAEWVPAAMLVVSRYEENPRLAEQLLGEIDRLAHVLRLLCQGGPKRQRRFAEVVMALHAATDLAKVEASFQLSREEVRTLLYNLRDIHLRAPAMCKLLLMRLDDEMSGLLPSYEPTDFSVEHVLPARPSAKSAWMREFPDAQERNACTHSLGNLVLLTHKQNDRARNEDFDRKREIYRTPEVGRPILTVTREVLESDTWTANDIRSREARLLGLAGRMLRLDYNSAVTEGEARRRQAGAAL